MAKTKEEIAQIKAALKAQYNQLNEIEIENDNGEVSRTIFLKKLDRNTLSAVLKIIKQDELKGSEVLLRNTYVGGDDLDEIVNDLEMLLGIQSVLGNLFTAKSAKLKKS